MGEGQSLLPMLLIFVVFIVFMIIPQFRRQKEEKKFSTTLKKGDRIITKGGLHGKVFDVSDKDTSFVLETMSGKLKMERSAISMEMSKKLNVPTTSKK